MTPARWLRIGGLALGALAGCGVQPATGLQARTARPAHAGADTVQIAAGARYHAGWLRRLLLGDNHRDLWAAPIAIEVLDLGSAAGGLEPLRCGGGQQTASLRLRRADGVQLVFRSIDKDPRAALPPAFRETFAEDLLQDQISSAHPAAPLVVAPLLAAAGVLHADPRLVVLADDPRIAPFGCVHPGMLGAIEVRPTADPDDRLAFAGASHVVGTAKLFDLLEHDPTNRVDSRAFLAARLLDVYVGDWDRHQDQWRWARFDRGDLHWWQPIPRDRDWAFPRHDGWLVWLAGFYYPQIVGFGDRYPSVFRLTWAGHVLDRRLLADLERPVWDSVAAAVQARLTDSVIDAAVHHLPPEYYATSGPELGRALRARRDALPEVASRFYRLLAREVDVHATDEADAAEIERLDAGRVAVRMSAGGRTSYARTFAARETHEIRLYLHGGEDRVVLRGTAADGPLLRVIGGGGDDALMDSARAGETHFYDHRGRNRFVRGTGTSVHRGDYDQPPADSVSLARPQDWGSRTVPLVWMSLAPQVGLLGGGGVMHTRYGFRRFPYRSRLTFRAAYAASAATFRADVTGEFRGVVAPFIAELHVRVSGIEVVRFFGFGNETAAPAPDDFYNVRQHQYIVAPSLRLPVSRAVRLSLGPVVQYARTDLDSATFLGATAPQYSTGSFGQLGIQTEFNLDTRDGFGAPSRGLLITIRGAHYPGAWDVRDPFTAVHGDAAGYWSPAAPATLAFRVGGARVWGRAPFHEAAFVGGASTLPGYPEHRFAGDRSAYAGGEFRLKVAEARVLLPVEVGVHGLVDAGRVWLEGEDSDRWHTAAGGGVWFAFLDRANVVTITVAQSPERTAVYVRAGFLF